MPAGRPTKYDPAFCNLVIECGEEGKTLMGMADACDVDRHTMNRWMDEREEFRAAVKRGLEKAQAWWEEKGRQATFGAVDGFNATSYIFQMKNRFREDWADRSLVGSDPENPLPSGFSVNLVNPAKSDGDKAD